MHNSIPADIKLLVGVAKLHYVDAFDRNFTRLLRERKSTNLPVMFQDSLEVESNRMVSGKIKKKMETQKVREDGSSTIVASANDVMFEMMLKMIEKLMDKLSIDNGSLNREQNEPQIRNPNIRRQNPPQPPQIRQREARNPRNPNDQQIQ